MQRLDSCQEHCTVDHITPALKELHWSDFKVSVLMFKALNGSWCWSLGRGCFSQYILPSDGEHLSSTFHLWGLNIMWICGRGLWPLWFSETLSHHTFQTHGSPTKNPGNCSSHLPELQFPAPLGKVMCINTCCGCDIRCCGISLFNAQKQNYNPSMQCDNN